jgi:uncharacterized membrane protein
MTDRLLRRPAGRLPAIDVVRGFVMIVMTLDHASGSFNAGRIMSDGAATVHPGAVLDPLQFVTRWVTHVCAPTFVFLAGLSLALSVARRRGDGVLSSLIDRDILIRGVLLIVYFYPVVPWIGFVMLGWAVGMRIGASPEPGMRARAWLALAGIAAVTFVIVRGGNGYGNAHLLRADGSWIEWLHVSKYPPSLAYAALELAIAFGLIAVAWRWSRPWRPLVVLGQTALFYYLLHASGEPAALSLT